EKATPGGTPTIKLEGPLFTVKEEAASDILNDDLRSRPETSVSSSSYTQVPSEAIASRMQTPSSAQETVDLTAADDGEASEDPAIPNLVKLYVDDQVRRWERVSLEFVMSPMIEYAWPHPTPSFQAWYGTVLATSEYLASRVSSGTRAQTWISEWKLVRLAPNMSADLTSVTVPLNELSMREYHSEEMKPEDAEGDSLMSSYEAELLGSECVTRWKRAGVRVYRSPASSSLGEPESKRQQYAPPRPSSIPSMSSLMSYRTSTQDDRSMATPSDMSAARSGSPMPSSVWSYGDKFR
ncbi:hypothetical protein PHMEG_00039843, partial [Phytophthora megakarya]